MEDMPTITITDFAREYGITMTCRETNSNPNMPDAPLRSFHFMCTLQRGKATLHIPFTMGPALLREPTLEDVLHCLMSDASSYETVNGFEEWANELGLSADSLNARKTFAAVRRQTERLRKFLGEEAYDRLLYETESL